jgi:hypothetical protein
LKSRIAGIIDENIGEVNIKRRNLSMRTKNRDLVVLWEKNINESCFCLCGMLYCVLNDERVYGTLDEGVHCNSVFHQQLLPCLWHDVPDGFSHYDGFEKGDYGENQRLMKPI